MRTVPPPLPTLPDVPVIGGLVKWGWAAVSLQGFRTRHLRVEWHALQGCQIGGLPMMRWLQMTWLEPRPGAAPANAPPYAAPSFMPACMVFSEASSRTDWS